MSLYTPWAPVALSPNRRSSLFEPSLHRDVPLVGERNPELVRLAMRMGSLDRQASAPASLPPIEDLLVAKRLPQSAASTWSAVTPTGPNYFSHLVSQKFAHSEYGAQPLRRSASPVVIPRYAQPSSAYHHAAMDTPISMYLKSAKPPHPLEDASYSSPIVSPTLSFHVRPAYLPHPSEVPRRSKAALAAEDWDHPSFARPPHRPIEPQGKAMETSRASNSNSARLDAPYDLLSSLNTLNAVEAEPLVPNSYPVPPPSPYEQSAAPFSDFAAEMVWERCLPNKGRNISPPSSAAMQWDSTFPWSIPKTCHTGGVHYSQPCQPSHSTSSVHRSSDWMNSSSSFGVIGAEAKARRFQCQYHSSSASPPPTGSLSDGLDIKKTYPGTRTHVKPAFRRWTRQVLEQTLLSPQVLVLALYYVNSVAGTDVFGDSNSKLSLLPFKLLLAALVLANKTLDDHSYKNSTFATVSSMTNAEVNVIEVALLKALNFNVVPSLDQWSSWLKEVEAASDRTGFNMTDVRLRHPDELFQASYQLKTSEARHTNQPSSFHTVDGGSIFDKVVSPPGLYRRIDSVNEATSWGRMTNQKNRLQSQSTYTPVKHTHVDAQSHQFQSTAEFYREHLRGRVGVDLAMNPPLNHGPRAYPIFG